MCTYLAPQRSIRKPRDGLSLMHSELRLALWPTPLIGVPAQGTDPLLTAA
ncbi:hypothetical protein ACSVIJ_14260 [Pseudomonas sp. NCHU5208]